MALSYKDAVAFVLEKKGAAFAFLPKTKEVKVGNGKANETIGGRVYIIVYCHDHESEPNEYPEYHVHFTAGLFNSSEAEEETYFPEDVPLEAQKLTYRSTKFEESILSNEIQIVLRDLEAWAEKT